MTIEPEQARASTQSPESRLPRGLSAFRHRNFRLFWTGMLVSLIGTWMQSVGQAWLVLQLTNDPISLGIVAAALFAPVLVFGLFGGIVADAVSKRNMLYFTQTAAALLACVLAIALAAVLSHRDIFAGRRVGVVLSGGNVDLDALPDLLAAGA